MQSSRFKHKRWNKRGNSALESFTIGISMFAFAFMFIAIYAVVHNVNTFIQNDAGWNLNNQSRAMMAEQDTNLPKVFDGIIVLLTFGLWGVAMIGAFLIDSHPVFAIFMFLALACWLVIGAYLGNAYQDATATGPLATYSAQLPWTGFIFQHILELMAAVGFSVAIVLFGKARSG